MKRSSEVYWVGTEKQPEELTLTNLLHAGYNPVEISITGEDDEGSVGFTSLDRDLRLFYITVWVNTVLVGRVWFRAGELLGDMGEGCGTAVLFMGEAEDEVQTDLRVLSASKR